MLTFVPVIVDNSVRSSSRGFSRAFYLQLNFHGVPISIIIMQGS